MRYPEVLSRVWLQLMCCALLINLVPNFRTRSKGWNEVEDWSKVGEKNEIENLC